MFVSRQRQRTLWGLSQAGRLCGRIQPKSSEIESVASVKWDDVAVLWRRDRVDSAGEGVLGLVLFVTKILFKLWASHGMHARQDCGCLPGR